MNIKILADNNTLIDKYFLGEPAVSYYIEADGKKLLFDLGYSNVFLDNAKKMGVNLSDIEYVVFSHGHNDHTWGVSHLINYFESSKRQGCILNKPELITHPLALCKKVAGTEEIGINTPERLLCEYFKLTLSKVPYWISDKLVYLGEIERTNNFENKTPIGRTFINGVKEDDYVLDDSALVYKSAGGLVIITGCSHSGICNIIEYAKKICNDSRVIDIIGGLHLLNPDLHRLDRTLDYFRSAGIEQAHPCHCTDLQSKIQLSQVLKINEVGVGLELEYK